MSVCVYDGVPVTVSSRGVLVHLDSLPKGVEPDHDVIAVPEIDFRLFEEKRFSLKAAAEDMLAHHATLHPEAGCEWAVALQQALRSA